MKTVLVLLATFASFSAFAKTYTGQYDDRSPCYISIQKTSADTSIIQLTDSHHISRYEAQITNRTHLGMKNGKVYLTVTSYTQATKTPTVIAQSFEAGKVKTCTAAM